MGHRVYTFGRANASLVSHGHTLSNAALRARWHAVDRFPAPGDVPPDLDGRILYNLTWISEVEFEKLSTKAGVAESFADIEEIRKRAKPLNGLTIKDLIEEGRR